ncbi:MAG: hypothetical protein ACRD1G_16655 [Acidimicrobiales bacterium]
MVNLLYAAVPIALALLISLLVLARGRRPKSMEHGMKEFSRELGALSPDTGPLFGRGRSGKGAEPG